MEPIKGLVRQLGNPPERIADREALLDREVGVQGAAALLLASLQRMGSWSILAEAAGFFSKIQTLIGATKPLEAEPGTIRGDLAVNIGRNVIHGSDAPETAIFEIGLWFAASELCEWTPADQVWRVEP